MATDRPNLILITTDQQRFDTIHHATHPFGVGPNGSIFTPHLNWLLAQGIHFRRCYTDTPVCGPARATIMTGRHGYTNRTSTNTDRPSPMAEHPTLPGVLGNAGYQTKAVGKMHFNPLRACYGFDDMELLPDYFRDMARRGADVGRPKDHGVGQNEMEPTFETVPESLSMTRWIVDRSIDFLETRDDTRPFFLWSSFPKPHPPFDPDPKYWQLYDGMDLPEPHIGDWCTDGPDDAFAQPSYSLNKLHRFSPQQLRQTMRAYYACITQIDYNLGYLFARLREMGRLEDTWIVFTSDHGEMLGDHHLGAKTVFFEGSAHIPMLVRPPSQQWAREPLETQGATCDEIVCLADVMPFFLSRAGAEVPGSVEGHDLLDVFKGQARRERMMGHSGGYFALIEGSMKYHYAAQGNRELLFDLDGDPYECHNLAGNGIPEAMRKRMVDFVRQHLPAAVEGDRLVGTGPARSEREGAGSLWPGFHSREVDTDVMH